MYEDVDESAVVLVTQATDFDPKQWAWYAGASQDTR